MPHIRIARMSSGALMFMLTLLVSVAFAGCGGGSDTTTVTQAGHSSPGGNGPGRARFSAMRECMRKQGVPLPGPPSPAQSRPGGRAARPFTPGARILPKGVSRSKLQAAMKKCGAGNFRGPRRFQSARFTQALMRFAACMQANGVKLPKPDTSGEGPVFSTRGLDANSAKFKAARSKCAGQLPGGFANRTPGSPPPGEAPPPQ